MKYAIVYIIIIFTMLERAGEKKKQSAPDLARSSSTIIISQIIEITID